MTLDTEPIQPKQWTQTLMLAAWNAVFNESASLDLLPPEQQRELFTKVSSQFLGEEVDSTDQRVCDLADVVLGTKMPTDFLDDTARAPSASVPEHIQLGVITRVIETVAPVPKKARFTFTPPKQDKRATTMEEAALPELIDNVPIQQIITAYAKANLMYALTRFKGANPLMQADFAATLRAVQASTLPTNKKFLAKMRAIRLNGAALDDVTDTTKQQIKKMNADQKEMLKSEILLSIYQLLIPSEFLHATFAYQHSPGSDERIVTMAAREAMGLPIFMAGDCDQFAVGVSDDNDLFEFDEPAEIELPDNLKD